MMLCRTSRRAKKGATGSSNNRGRRKIGGRENLKQAVSERQEQVLSTLKEIYSRIRYLGEKREFKEYKKSNQRI